MISFKAVTQVLGAILLAWAMAFSGAGAHGAGPRRAPDPLTAGRTTPGFGSYDRHYPMTLLATANLGVTSVTCAALDSAGAYAYYGVGATPARVIKVRLADMQCVGTVTLGNGETNLTHALLDDAGNVVYFVSQDASRPAVVIKVSLSSMQRLSALTLDAGEKDIKGAAIDPAGGYAYLLTGATPGAIVKVRLSVLARIGALTLNAGEEKLVCAVADPAGGNLYVGANPSGPGPASVIKVGLADFKRVAALTLNSGDEPYTTITDAAIDLRQGNAYFLHNVNEGLYTVRHAARIRLSDFTITGITSLGLLSYYYMYSSDSEYDNVLFDSIHDYFYFNYRNVTIIPTPWVITTTEYFERRQLSTGALRDHYGTSRPANPLLDSPGAYAYLRYGATVQKMDLGTPFTATTSTFANRITLPTAANVKDVRFFSHVAIGQVRLAIYSDTASKMLLWQSGAVDNATAAAFLTVPVSQGTPSQLTLPPGKYWLAWQSTAPATIASYSPGLLSEGFVAPWKADAFEPFPRLLGPDDHQPASAQWSEYITYDVGECNAARAWTRYQ